MGIRKLEDATARVLCASQTLTDPASVIKELVDNALDGMATLVAVEIHANTLDVILVRDNGHGIAPDDRPLMAVPGCTSKITDLDDLRMVGGTSLGFRGQALASIAELSGTLTISTRVEGEPVAAVLSINRDGSIGAEHKAPLPIGTTIKVTDFLKVNPVRRIEAMKASDKVLRKIRALIQGYAFARRHVRFSFRVLKAKNDKVNFMYAPQPDESMPDAARKIIGSACASQCQLSVAEDDEYTVTAVLPRADADMSRANGLGAFVSVDGRPVSAGRGLFKQIVRSYRSIMKAADSIHDTIRDPFLYLDISCPEEAYDPNVEPAKDDLLFSEPDRILNLAESAFRKVHPIVEEETRDPLADASLEHSMCSSLADDASVSVRDEPSDRVHSTQEDQTPLNSLHLPPQASDEPESDEDLNDINVSNPWILAKLNTRIKATPQNEAANSSRRSPSPIRKNFGILTPAPSSSPWKSAMAVDLDTSDGSLIHTQRTLLGSTMSESESALHQTGQRSEHSFRPLSVTGSERNCADTSILSRLINKPFKSPTQFLSKVTNNNLQRPLIRHDRPSTQDPPSMRSSLSVGEEEDYPLPLSTTKDGDIRSFALQRRDAQPGYHRLREQSETDPDDDESPPPSEMNAQFDRVVLTTDDDGVVEQGLFVSDDESVSPPNPQSKTPVASRTARGFGETPAKQRRIDLMMRMPAGVMESNDLNAPLTHTEKAKPNRSRAYMLPLERIPLKKRVHDVVAVLDMSLDEVSQMASSVDQPGTLIDLEQPTLYPQDWRPSMLSMTADHVAGITGTIEKLLRSYAAGYECAKEDLDHIQDALKNHIASYNKSLATARP